MSKVVIFGSGQGAKTAFRYLTKDSEHEICAFTADREFIHDDTFLGLPVIDFAELESRFPSSDYKMFLPMGSHSMNRIRQAKYDLCKSKGYELISYVSSTVQFRSDLQIGENCFILQNNAINFDVKIGNNVTIWSSNQIGDRSVIGDHCWITSEVCIAGDVQIGKNCFLAINCSISNGVKVADDNFIGANSLITKNTEPKDVYLIRQTPKAPLNSDKFCLMMNETVN